MFAAKELGRGRIEVFDEPMRERAVAPARDRESALRRALVRGEFRVHYQPLVRVRVVGGDRPRGAACAGSTPSAACSRPTSSSTVAEETGLIVPIGAWVLREACAQAATLGRGVAEHDAARRSRSTCRRASSPTTTSSRPSSAALAASGLDPSLLVLEITETTLDGRPRARDRRAAPARRARACASASTTSAPASRRSRYLRVAAGAHAEDRPVVHRRPRPAIPKAPRSSSAVVQLGHALGLSVTAEGVETPGQLAELRALGCDLGQGYYFAHPQPGRDRARARAPPLPVAPARLSA